MMNINELYLKTTFCCMACDGEIANEEVELIRQHINQSDLYAGLEVEHCLNLWINDINAGGNAFLMGYLKELTDTELTEEQELQIVRLAVEMIEADNIIQYSEVKFFKKIRSRLSLSDESILAEHPDKEDWLLPDIKIDEDFLEGITFAEIHLDINNQ